MSVPRLFVGIDPGVHTGIAEAVGGKLCAVTTMKIHDAMDRVRVLSGQTPLTVVIEDARLRKWFGGSGREQLQGAGSIKRDCGIWSDFLADLGVPYKAISPKAKGKKYNSEQFAALTGWDKRTSEHSRDAAMLVWGLV